MNAGTANLSGAVNCAVLNIDANTNSTNALQMTGTDSSLYARANGTIYRVGFAGLQFVGDTIRAVDGTGSGTSADAREVSLGTSSNTFKDGHFSGTVNSGDATFSGKVGIGMTPAVRLKAWKEAFDTRLKADPKADKEAVLRDITDGAFGVMPTEEIVAEWMEGRAAGDALQVQGNGSFSGTVNAGSAYIKQGSVGNRGGAQFGSANGSLQLNNSFTHFEPSTDAVVDLGSTTTRFKNAHFSDTMNAGAVKVVTSANSTNAITLQGPSTKTFIRSNGVVLQEGVAGINFSGGKRTRDRFYRNNFNR